MLHSIQITGGLDKDGHLEPVKTLTLERGQIYAIIGQTGAGKTLLLEDIESLNNGEGQSKRVIRINGEIPGELFLQDYRSKFIAHLSQKMNYVMDIGVLEFLSFREYLKSHQKENISSQESFISEDFRDGALKVLEQANLLAGERIEPLVQLTKLSGGQSRALMIADIALNTAAPVILIDEVENAGIDKRKALSLLAKQDKIVLVVTHDPLLALYGHQRILLVNGSMHRVIRRTEQEIHLLNQLGMHYEKLEVLRQELRSGKSWESEVADVI